MERAFGGAARFGATYPVALRVTITRVRSLYTTPKPHPNSRDPQVTLATCAFMIHCLVALSADTTANAAGEWIFKPE